MDHQRRHQFDQSGAKVILTANSPSWRLQADQIVYGQNRRSHAQVMALRADPDACEDFTWYNGLPTVFNPDGLPNKAPAYAAEGWGVTDTRGGVPVFCEPGSIGAKFWTWLDVFDYLQWFYNPNQEYVVNYLPTADEYANAQPFTLAADFTGMTLLEAWRVPARASATCTNGSDAVLRGRRRQLSGVGAVRHRSGGVRRPPGP